MDCADAGELDAVELAGADGDVSIVRRAFRNYLGIVKRGDACTALARC